MTDEDIKKELYCCVEKEKLCTENCRYYGMPQSRCKKLLSEEWRLYVSKLREEVTGLTGALEAAKRDKKNLERTLEEINQTLSANGISIDYDGNVSYSGKTDVLAKIENYIDGIRYYLDKRYEIQSCYSNEEEVVVNLATTDGSEVICSLSLEELLNE